MKDVNTHQWERVHDSTIIRQGDAWSSLDFKPDPEDYATIATYALRDADSTPIEIGIVHDMQRIRIVELDSDRGDVEWTFVDQGAFFWSDRPMFTSEWMCEFMLLAAKYHDGEVRAADMAPLLFPRDWLCGKEQIRRNPEDTSQWISDPYDPRWDTWEPFNGEHRSKDLTHTNFHRLRDNGYMENVKKGVWTLKNVPV